MGLSSAAPCYSGFGMGRAPLGIGLVLMLSDVCLLIPAFWNEKRLTLQRLSAELPFTAGCKATCCWLWLVQAWVTGTPCDIRSPVYMRQNGE